MIIDTAKLETLISKFSEDRDWVKFHSVKNLSMALSVESSELLEIFQWMPEEDSNQIKADPQTYQAAKDEVADIFIYLLKIASRLEIDLEDAVVKKMDANSLKYPVEKSRGLSKKYTQYQE